MLERRISAYRQPTVLLTTGIIFVTVLAFIFYFYALIPPNPPNGNDGPEPDGNEPEPPEELEGKIFFLSNREGNWDIFVMNPNGTNQTKFFSNPVLPIWEIHPDGTKKRVNSTCSIYDFDISPDGTQLVFSAVARFEIIEETEHSASIKVTEDLYLVNISLAEMKVTSLPVKIVDDSARDFDPHFSPNPNNKVIAFVSERGDGNPKIYIKNLDTGKEIRLTKYWAMNPDWSPDGEKIAFNSGDTRYGVTSGNNILVVNANGSNIIKTTDGLNDENPAWRGDGLQFAFVSTVRYGENWAREIFVINIDGSGRKQITSEDPMNPYNFTFALETGDWPGHKNPVWLPNGQLLCEFHNNGNIQILLMNADGSNIQQLTSSEGGKNWHPVFVPTNP